MAAGVADRGRVVDHTFARNGEPESPRLAWFVDGLARAMRDEGYAQLDTPGPQVQVVLHLLDTENPQALPAQNAPDVRRRARLPPRDAHRPPAHRVPVPRARPRQPRGPAERRRPTVRSRRFVTLEQGTYRVDHQGDDDKFFAAVLERVEPLAHLAARDRQRVPPRPARRRCGPATTQTEQITRAGERLGALDLLPAAFPIEEILSERDLRHVKLLYGIGGLSYGNVSARRLPPTESAWGPEFWMSASGVDKSNLREIGRDVLLVKGYEPARDSIILSIPPDVKPNRVSVDAIEHWMIYREHPEVRRDPPRARVDRGHRRHGDQLPVRHGRARHVGRRARAPGARPAAARSSARRTTASPSPGTRSTRSSPASTAGSSAPSPWTDPLRGVAEHSASPAPPLGPARR